MCFVEIDAKERKGEEEKKCNEFDRKKWNESIELNALQ